MAGTNVGNKFVGWLLKSPLHGLLDASTMLLSVTGRTSGNPVTTPVNYTREGDVLWVTSQRSRQWWKNCRKCTQVKLLLKGQWVDGEVEVLESREESLAAFKHLFDLAPGLAKLYGVKTGGSDSLDSQKLDALVERSLVLKIDLSGRGG